MNPDLPTHTDTNPFNLASTLVLIIVGTILLLTICFAGWSYVCKRTTRTEEERIIHRSNIARMTVSVN